METKRRKFQGVLNILSFNRHYYYFGGVALLFLFTSRLFISWPATLFWGLIVAFVYGLVMPLIVSAYVYDYSGYYHLDWLEKMIQQREAKLIVSINAGFD